MAPLSPPPPPGWPTVTRPRSPPGASLATRAANHGLAFFLGRGECGEASMQLLMRTGSGKRGGRGGAPQGTSRDRECCRTCSSMAYPPVPRGAGRSSEGRRSKISQDVLPAAGFGGRSSCPKKRLIRSNARNAGDRDRDRDRARRLKRGARKPWATHPPRGRSGPLGRPNALPHRRHCAGERGGQVRERARVPEPEPLARAALFFLGGSVLPSKDRGAARCGRAFSLRSSSLPACPPGQSRRGRRRRRPPGPGSWPWWGSR